MKFLSTLCGIFWTKLRTLSDMTRHRMRIAPNTVAGEQREKKFRRGVLLMGGELVRVELKGWDRTKAQEIKAVFERVEELWPSTLMIIVRGGLTGVSFFLKKLDILDLNYLWTPNYAWHTDNIQNMKVITIVYFFRKLILGFARSNTIKYLFFKQEIYSFKNPHCNPLYHFISPTYPCL